MLTAPYMEILHDCRKVHILSTYERILKIGHGLTKLEPIANWEVF